MVRINLGNFVAVGLMALLFIFIAKWAAPFVPVQAYRDIVGAA
jgi:hypothetical protein